MNLLKSFVLAAALAHPASALEITIHLYDYSGLQPAALTEAQHSAGETLRQAGINVQWRICPVAGSDGLARPSCGSGTADVTHFVVAVLPESMSRKIAPKTQQYGMAITGHEGGFPTQAYVFSGRVLDLVKDETGPWSQLFGTVIAHEVGHLLLGTNSHFPFGIMRAQWRSGEIKRALTGVLIFTPQEAQKMRADLVRRARTKE